MPTLSLSAVNIIYFTSFVVHLVSLPLTRCSANYTHKVIRIPSAVYRILQDGAAARVPKEEERASIRSIRGFRSLYLYFVHVPTLLYSALYPWERGKFCLYGCSWSVKVAFPIRKYALERDKWRCVRAAARDKNAWALAHARVDVCARPFPRVLNVGPFNATRNQIK